MLLARDPKTRQALDKTVWEAHFGVRPNLRDYLIAPWGCMCYLVLTPDQRQARGADNAFGIRAIGGIYLGVVCNPRTPYVQHLMTDGKTIFTSPNNIRCVGDAFPFKWQRGRDIQLNLDGPPSDDETMQPASAMHAMPAPRALSAQDLVQRAEDDRQQEFQAEHAFIVKSDRRRDATKYSANVRKRLHAGKRQIFRQISTTSGQQDSHFQRVHSDVDDCFKELPDDDAYVAPDDPADLIFEVAPPNLSLEQPYDGARYYVHTCSGSSRFYARRCASQVAAPISTIRWASHSTTHCKRSQAWSARHCGRLC